MQICKNVANVSRSPIVGGCLMMHLKIIYLLQKVLLEPMGMRFPLWSRVVSGLRHHLMKKKYLTQCPQKRASYRSCSLVSEFGWSRCVCKPEDDSRYHIWRGEGNPYPTSWQTTWMVCLLPRPCRSENKCDICGNILKSKFKLNNHIVIMRLKMPKMRNCVHAVGDWWFYQWIFLHCRGQTAERVLCVEWFSTTLPLLFGQSSAAYCIVLY